MKLRFVLYAVALGLVLIYVITLGAKTRNQAAFEQPTQSRLDSTRASFGPDYWDNSATADTQSELLDSMLNDFAPADGSEQAAELEEAQAQGSAKVAQTLLKQAAARNDKTFLQSLSKLNPRCAWCNDFYAGVRTDLSKPELSSSERAFLANALALSGRGDNIKSLVDGMQDAVNSPELGGQPRPYSQALEQANLHPEVVDQIAADLQSENPYLREAALSILTKQGTPEAAQRLLQYTQEQNSKDGFYDQGLGIAKMIPKAETLPYLEDLVQAHDQYSHLAIKSLLNYGNEGLDRVVKLIENNPDLASDYTLFRKAVDHVSHDAESLTDIKKLTNSSSPALKAFAQNALKELQIDQDRQNRGIEYNENFEDGIIRDPVVPQG